MFLYLCNKEKDGRKDILQPFCPFIIVSYNDSCYKDPGAGILLQK